MAEERPRVHPEEIAKFFHHEYERLAEAFSYETRRETAVPWEKVMDSNKRLMVAVATSIMLRYFPDRLAIGPPAEGKEGVAEHGYAQELGGNEGRVPRGQNP
jgi:hypothetical protein